MWMQKKSMPLLGHNKYGDPTLPSTTLPSPNEIKLFVLMIFEYGITTNLSNNISYNVGTATNLNSKNLKLQN